MKTRLSLLSSIVVGLAACGDDAPPVNTGPIPVVFQSKWAPQAQFVGYYAAGGHAAGGTASTMAPLEGGMNFYEAEGLDVTVVPGLGLNPSEEVAMGNADIGTDWIANMVQAIENNDFELLHVAQIYQRPGFEFVSLATDNITTLNDFVGKTVGIWDFGNEFPAEVCFTSAGLTSADEDDTPSQEPDLRTRTYAFDPAGEFPENMDVATAMVYNELNQIVGLGNALTDLNRISAADAGCGLLEDFIFTTAAMLDDPNFKNYGVTGREVVVRFVRATLKGWAWAIESANRAQAVQLMLEFCDTTCAGSGTIGNQEHQEWQLDRVAELVQPGLLAGGTNRTLGCLDSTEYDETLNRLRSVGLITEGTGTNVLRPQILTDAGTTCP